MQEQSQLLTDFYRAYLDFADNGENPHNFSYRCGLCSSLVRFIDAKFATDYDYYLTCDEMSQQFKDSALDKSYPFNNGSGKGYDLEMKDGSTTKNEMRMKWVRDHAKLDEL